MIQTNIPHLSNEEILKQIELELQREKLVLPQQTKHHFQKTSHTVKLESVNIYSFAVKIGKLLQKNGLGRYAKKIQKFFKLYPQNRVHIMDDFVKYHDEEFIDNLYNLLFYRNPTAKEKEQYLALLRSGKLSKTEIVITLYYSKEAREQNILILGVKKRYALMLLYKIPVLGYLAKIAYIFLTLPRLLARITSHENFFFSKIQEHELRQNNLELQLQTKATDEKVSQLEAQLQLQIKVANERVNELEAQLQTKATNERVDAIDTMLQTKATNKSVIELASQTKATNERVDAIDTMLQTKATLEDFKYYMQTVLHAKEHMLDVQKNMQELIAQAKKRLPQEILQPKQLEAISQEEKHIFDAFYVAFEEKFRGSREAIKSRVAQYLSYVENLPFPKDQIKLLDVGCGRGEWLELLKENGYQAKGIDLNRMMVQKTQELSLEVEEADVIEYLRAQPDASLSFISGFHIIEHLPFDVLMTLLQESHRVLQKGGMVLFETPNPENLVVGACTFYTDPTHINPLVPNSVEFLLQYNSFFDTQILRVNGSFEVDLQNDFLNLQFNPQFDYAVIGYKV